jgi:hypothetical protein
MEAQGLIAVFDSKRIKKLHSYTFFTFLAIKTLDLKLELDPDPQLREMLDPDPH